MTNYARWVLLLATVIFYAGCANITAPTGGRKDTTPPRLIRVSPNDSLRNTRVKRIELDFDEYVTVTEAAKEVQLSPMLSVQPNVTALNKRVVAKIADSLLEDNTTYRISFGHAIKDIHEGNPFKNYTYTFSTGSYFDSLELRGTLVNAATGLSDTGGYSVVLYAAKDGDSAVIKHIPKYITHSENGRFVFKGLPKKRFRIYAIKDLNNNYMYDGPGASEAIAFFDSTVVPGDTLLKSIPLYAFKENPDTADLRKLETDKLKGSRMSKSPGKPVGLTYSVTIDTSNIEKRTFDINSTINVLFNKTPALNTEKITLLVNNAGVNSDVPADFQLDSIPTHLLHIMPAKWEENKVYTLRLAKGFAKDTADHDIMPSRFVFRTFEDQDYGKLRINIPAKYAGKPRSDGGKDLSVLRYVLRVNVDNDSAYQKTIADTVVALTRLKPGIYSFRIIVDKNSNGQWDTGDLFGKLQPEEVIAINETVTLKASWEATVDLEQKPKPTRKSALGTEKSK